MEVKKIVCPSCKATIDFSKSDKKEIKCEYCRSIVYLDDKGQVINTQESIEKLKNIADDAAKELDTTVSSKGFKIVLSMIIAFFVVIVGTGIFL